MKKIGILTYQYADNYGAVLQCYALRRLINTFENCNAEIINYRPPFFSYAKYWNNQYEKRLFERKRNQFERFLVEECKVKEQPVAHIDGMQYDYYCVGSDQIWNTMWDTEEFFLPNVPDEVVKIAYAPSIGLDVNSPYLNKNMLQKYLPRFKSLSIREQEHIALIETLTGRKCSCVLDPTLLLDPADYETIISHEKLRDYPFVFFFWLRHDGNLMRGIEFVNALSRKFDMAIVHSITEEKDYMFHKNGGCMMFEGVENFLWYIKNASFIVTNSYHATLFAIQFKTLFYTFIVETMRSRISTLIDKIGIEERVIKAYLPVEKIKMNLEFEPIVEKIELEKEISMKYLRQALDIV